MGEKIHMKEEINFLGGNLIEHNMKRYLYIIKLKRRGWMVMGRI